MMKIFMILLAVGMVIVLAMIVYHQHEQRQKAEIERVIREANEAMTQIETQRKSQAMLLQN